MNTFKGVNSNCFQLKEHKLPLVFGKENINDGRNRLLRLGLSHSVRPTRRQKWKLVHQVLPAWGILEQPSLTPHLAQSLCCGPRLPSPRFLFHTCNKLSHHMTKPHGWREWIKDMHRPKERLTWIQGQNHQQVLQASADIRYTLQG